jgi:hypothetical protein
MAFVTEVLKGFLGRNIIDDFKICLYNKSITKGKTNNSFILQTCNQQMRRKK